MVFYTIGALVAIKGRNYLGKQATGILVIREDHELIRSGIYNYIRHLIYSGAVIGLIGFGLIVQSILVVLITFILYFKILNDRVNHEENMLINEFRDQYTDYMRKGKKFIPFVF